MLGGKQAVNWLIQEEVVMIWEADGHAFENCVVIFKVKDDWGELSNMNNDFPLRVGGVLIRSSEALYQAMRYPHRPEWQKEILDAPHAMAAKMKSKKEGRRKSGSRPDWEMIQVDVMRWVLRVKLACHPRTFGRLLQSTRDWPIVEQSRKDRFWGAVPEADHVLRGQNWLGRLLMELRAESDSKGEAGMQRVEPLAIADFKLLDAPIGLVEVRAS